MDKIIALGADHGGYELKESIKEMLSALQGFKVLDLGTFGTESVDYPEYAFKTADAVLSGKAFLGILFCGTGVGISITANKVRGIRCAKVNTVFEAQMAKEHNNANIIALGGRVTPKELAKEIVLAFLNAEFAGGRHAKRLSLIEG
ncbi:MAG: ribose 5-phosphate isomerase B [Firmicutes bacterium]|nr:ribose 5-phosphate isomerase B [Bacillota bacterium]